MARPLQRLTAAIRGRPVRPMIVHPTPRDGDTVGVVAPGVKAVGVEEFLTSL